MVMKTRRHCSALVGTVALLIPAAPAQAQDAASAAAEVETIEVIANSPLGPADGDSRRATANVQRLSAEDLQGSGQRSIGEALQQLGSVFRTDATGNPFQPDLFYRGYSISPLLGLPQGMAVYQDGVRVNEPFGDTVNFDLVPLVALAGADLVPGSNPVFGRNTLGAALALRTKTGFDAPGAALELSGGEYGRWGVSGEYGVARDDLGVYLAAETFREDGWHDFSESRVGRVFARGTWLADAKSSIDLTLSAADNRLRGNGAAPRELLDEEGRDSVFTHPDETEPQLFFANLIGQRKFEGGANLSGNVYFRRNEIRIFNGDGTEFEECEDPANVDENGDPFLCEEDDDEEEVIEDFDGEPVVATDDNDSATQNRSRTDQDGYGVAAQWSQVFGAHRVAAGATLDFGDIDFASDTELGRLTENRGTVGSRIFVAESLVRVDARNDSFGVYLMDVWEVSPSFQLTLAGRWNRTEVELDDQVPDGDLSGDHRFSRFNPMLGYAWQFAPGWAAFGSVAQATRAPTPVELTCANPEDPCRLPNGFVDDPPLDEVVTRTAELGARYRGARLSGSAALFHAVSEDDILFITDGDLANQGYFDNVGETLRQGVELSLKWMIGRGWTAETQLTGLIAEFHDDFLVNTPNHPLRDAEAEADESTRQVREGDRIPLIPRYQYRAALGWSGGAFEAGVEVVGRGDSRFRGDEANVDSSRLGSFALVNVQADWELRPGLTLFASLDNLFDRDFETFGVYGEADEVLGEEFEDARRFVGAGSPMMVQGGVRLKF